MMIKLNFIKQQTNETFLSCLGEIESAFYKNESCLIQTYYSKSAFIKNTFSKLIIRLPKVTFFKGIKNDVNFAALMGLTFDFLLPSFYLSTCNYIYMFDAWPRFHPLLLKYAERLNIKIIFFSSKEIASRFNTLNSTVKGEWIPEGIDIDAYYANSYNEKDIDVLEFGRKYDLYHDLIRESLQKNGKRHFYEKQKGQVVFQTKSEFLKGLARAKITICVPSNITHPDRSENISTMTLRYLQSMASKCLIVGIMPEEMKDLFDYMPIIEINLDAPEKQILDILNDYESFIPLIEKNYKEVQSAHTWSVRVKKMLEIIENESAG